MISRIEVGSRVRHRDWPNLTGKVTTLLGPNGRWNTARVLWDHPAQAFNTLGTGADLQKLLDLEVIDDG